MNEIKMVDNVVMEPMFTDGKLPKGQILLNSLTPPAKLIIKTIVHNLLPKMSSMLYLNLDHAKLVYTSFARH